MNKSGAIENNTQLKVRMACEKDTRELCSILNEIIGIGGTTGFEVKFEESEFKSCFLDGDNTICCFLAENDGMITGFQSLSRHPDLADEWADIATFARVSPAVRGVGTRLFQTTQEHAQRNNIATLNATIRADNSSGLSYYNKMGFKNYTITKGVPLRDGTRVDRISKKYIVTML